MKYAKYLTIAMAAVLTISCNKEKTAIDQSNDAKKEAIDIQKTQVNADAKEAIKNTDANAKIDKAIIEANKESMQAQLDADKKISDAEAEAAKAKVKTEDK
jgi:hypothetical protein